MQDGNTDPKRKVKTTESVFEIVETILELQGATVTELTEEIDLSPSTIHKHLQTLVHLDYLEREGEKYQVGIKFLNLGSYARARKRINRIVESRVRKLAEETGERAQFLSEDNGMAVFIHIEHGPSAVQTNTRIGRRIHLHTSAAGKCMLAHMDRERAAAILREKGLPKLTEHSITDREQLMTELDEIRERGYALNREETTEGLHSIAAPVLSSDEIPAGVLGVSGPSNRLPTERLHNDISQTVLGLTNEIELEYNYDHESTL